MHFRIVTCLLLLCMPLAAADSFVYVSLSGENKIAIHQLLEGKLIFRGACATPGDPGSSAVHPSKRFVIAAMRDAGKLVSLKIHQDTGELEVIQDIKVDVDPAYVAFDQTGRYLLTAYYVTGKVAVHPVSSQGRIGMQGNWYATDEKAHAIITDRTNRWAFVPHTGPNAIFQFEFSAAEGTLRPNRNQPKVEFGLNTGPRHFHLLPNNRIGICDNEQGSSVTSFSLNADTGTLTPLQTVSTLPKDWRGSNSCARLAVHPNGEFAYASNRGHDSIAGFRIDPVSGELRRIGIFSCEKTPRGFAIDPTGEFLIAAGENSQRLIVYQIAKNGTLHVRDTYSTGRKPWWVTIVSL